MKENMRTLYSFILIVILTGCASIMASKWDSLYGTEDPARFDHPTPQGQVNYQHDVKPILDQRCVVCHACYDAPCQLKMTSYQGITRGASKQYIYESSRLLATEPTRLHFDALNVNQWRSKSFFPVLNERQNTPEANINASVLAQLLQQKQKHPLPQTQQLPDSFDLKLHRDQQCTNIDDYENYQKDYPLWGMPYGLPHITQKEHDTLIQWIEEGAPNHPNDALSKEQLESIKKWETFFNQDSLKAQLMSRYMYEHLYIGHLYFEPSPEPIFFELVRSRTKAPNPIDLIATRRPYDDPGVARVYYRLRPLQETTVAKTHMPYILNDERMDRWHHWFLDADYQVDELPNYTIETASNPFITFRQLPSFARYSFMLEEAQYTIMGFIKSPVCRGQVALNVINDYFWAVFIDPKYQTAELNSNFLEQHVNKLELPAEASSSAGVLNWVSYAANEQQYVTAKAEYLNTNIEKTFEISLDLLWDGEGYNDNAALTIFRHIDSASVIKGLHGHQPQTAWVITYPLLERIHYLLVAGFDVFGNVGHQLNTRIYMDFLRMEGEFNFLTFLPANSREKIHNHWYRGSVSKVKEYMDTYSKKYTGNSSVAFETNTPLQEMYNKMQEKLTPILSHSYRIDQGFKNGDIKEALLDLSDTKGIPVSIMAETSVLQLYDDQGNTHYYSLLSNNMLSNISHLLGEKDRRLPKEDTLTVAYGIISAYPNTFFKVSTERLREFVDQIQELQSDSDYKKLADQFGIRRTSNEFWQYSDSLHQWMQKHDPIQYGVLDYNRLENR